MTDKILEAVQGHPFAEGLTPEHCATLAALARRTSFAKDEIIFREGDPKHEFFLLLTGRAALEMVAQGRTLRVHTLEAGDELLGVVQFSRPSDALRVKNDNDSVLSFGQTKYQVTSRGGRGVKTSSRTGFVELIQPDIQLVDWSELGGVGGE